ncbi:integrase catalytic domain-containing protein [Trichonephila clavata]|uniref:Integrase catalytic domain-containing protein n=1 Tax=Trichonephila clavata TaxID=2740835 RepID=A0A8X6L3H2_TRICU|nr:integrase catalytic domain-containing protein [Trichonephila clavata]
MAKGVKILERKFCDIEKQLSGFIAFVDTFVEDDKEVLSFKLSQFDRLNAKYESVKEEIFTLSDIEFINFDGKITTCNEHIEKLEVRLKSLNLKYSKNNNEIGSNAVYNVIKPCFRLPELSLPQFNGDIETWFIFKEQFKEIIESCGLNDKQKLQYLQSCLIGIAKHVQTVDDTYGSLFLALEKRFENKRLIINKHINALLMLKYEKFKGDSIVELRNLVDTCTKHLRALKLLKIEHNTFSELLLIQLVMQVLDTETKRLFEMTLESADIPKWDDFLAFLNKCCLFLENLPSAGTKDKQNFKDSPRHKSFILHTDANVDKKCKLCSLNHDLYNCDKFKNMPVRERYNIVTSLNLCLKCLKPNHKVSQCRSQHICFCKKNHNQLLHFVNVKNQEMQNFESSQPDTRRQDDVIEPICFQNSSIKNNQNKTDRNSFNFPSAQNNIVQGQVSGVNMSISASQKHKNDIILSTCIIYVENSVGEKFLYASSQTAGRKFLY